MTSFVSDKDPGGLKEFSVVYTDRSLNHMSQRFQSVMRDVSSTMKQVYNAETCILVPGGGSYGMEAIARQFATGKKCFVVRNGWFSYRWTQIFETCNIPSSSTVFKARRQGDSITSPFAPELLENVVRAILEEKPDLVFAPHVETSSGIILPPEYLKALADAIHAVGGMLVIDCVASGCMWLNMKELGVDVLLSAPQKGWSASPSCGIVMLSELATSRIEATTSTSFACDLKKWLAIMKAYENFGHAYHATMPTDAIVSLWSAMKEAEHIGFQRLRDEQVELGQRVRSMLESRGFLSVAAEGYKAPSVVVSYCSDPDVKTGKKFASFGMQIAAGVPLQCDEGTEFSSFRIGLFGLSKLLNLNEACATIIAVLDKF
jgi:aspartate aminotransferase-like enzyme